MSDDIKRDPENSCSDCPTGTALSGLPEIPDLEAMSLDELKSLCEILLKRSRELEHSRRELEKSVIRYADFYDLSPVGYCTISEKGIVLEANETAMDLLGCSRDDLLCKPLSKFILNDDLQIYYRHRKKLFEEGTLQKCDLRMVRKSDGVQFWMHLKCTVALDLATIEADSWLCSGNAAAGVKVCRLLMSDITGRKESERSLKAGSDRLKLALNAAKAGCWEWDLDTNENIWSDEIWDLYGLRRDVDEPGYDSWLHSIHPDYRESVSSAVADSIAREEELDIEWRVNSINSVRWIMSRGQPERDENDRLVRYIGTVIDITERKRIESVLAFLVKAGDGSHGENFFNSVAEYLAETLEMDFVCIDRLEGDGLTARTVSVWYDGHFEDNMSYALKDTPCGEVVGKSVCCFTEDVRFLFPADQVLQEMEAESYVGVTLWSHTGMPIGLIAVIGRSALQNRRLAEETLKLVAVRVAGELDRLDAEEENSRLERQLQQARKMESVGRLAGGVAHDFNNILGVILGYTEMALEEIDSNFPLHEKLSEIRSAALHSADLVRQLLAFARRQTIAPKVLDLNATVEGMIRMLKRLIGENIELCWRPGEDLWSINFDPSQIDQILANLCVNARDAISGVGEITIETNNVTFDDSYHVDNFDACPGDYVQLTVSDNGCGMERDTIRNLFEPFFTTKEAGKGTGLGLATVYGIVRQNNGFINVYSEPLKGSTFKIYLVRYIGKGEQMEIKEAAGAAVKGHETILLVEDQPAILKMTTMILKRSGYRVLPAPTPGEAIKTAVEHEGDIHMLITDVVMPEMNGRELAGKLLSIYPGIKRLFMSGYTANVIAHHGVLDEGVHFIQKPFSMGDLTAMVRKVLDS